MNILFIYTRGVNLPTFCFKFIPLLLIFSSIDEAAKEKLAPFSSLTNDESYQSRDLEKVK